MALREDEMTADRLLLPLHALPLADIGPPVLTDSPPAMIHEKSHQIPFVGVTEVRSLRSTRVVARFPRRDWFWSLLLLLLSARQEATLWALDLSVLTPESSTHEPAGQRTPDPGAQIPRHQVP